jgi:hypothetical protein
MSSRFNRGASASALTVRGQPCDFGVSEKLGWTRRRVRDWIKPNPEMPDGNPSPGIRPWVGIDPPSLRQPKVFPEPCASSN